MIDIIIPCYNSHKTIDRCLGSILSQNILNSCKITLVNDGGKDYSDIVERYSSVMDIKEIGYSENKGAGYARNYGIKNTKEPFITFIDSDDCFSNVFAILMMINQMYSDSDNIMVISNFIEEVNQFKINKHEQDITFMHGKMYKREYIEENNIEFNLNTRINEDVGFNLVCLLLTHLNNKKVAYSDYVTYYWLNNPESTVRKNKDEFDCGIGFTSYIDNVIYAFSEVQKREVSSYQINFEKVVCLFKIYYLYLERNKIDKYKETNLQSCKEYYQKIYKPIEDIVTEHIFIRAENEMNKEGFNILVSDLKKFIEVIKK